MLICAVAFDGAGYLKLRLANREYKAAQNEEESSEESQVKIDEFSKKLTDDQINEVKNVVSLYKTYQKNYDDTVNYINNSILMQLDPNSICTDILQYQINTHYSVTYPEIAKTDYTQDILDSIYYRLLNDSNCKEIAKALGKNISSEYIKELVTPVMNTRTDDDTPEYKDNVFTLSIMGRSYSECDKITAVIQKDIVNVFAELKTKYGAFDYTDLGVQHYKSFSQDVLTAQKNQANSLKDIRTNSEGLIDAFTADQKTYFYALLNGDDTVSISLPIDQNGTPAASSSPEPVTVRKFIPKYIVVGAMAGLILSFLYFMCLILAGAKLMSDDLLEKAFGYDSLGSLRVTADPRGFLSGIDRSILRSLDGGAAAFSAEERMRMIAAGIRIAARKNGWKNIYMTGSSADEQTRSTIKMLVEQSGSGEEKVSFGNSVVYDPESLENMASSDAVVVVEREDYSKIKDIDRECALFKKNEVPVLGYVVLK